MRTRLIILALPIITTCVAGYLIFQRQQTIATNQSVANQTESASQKPVSQPTHQHADIAIYLNGEKLSLDDDKYQTSEGHEYTPAYHLHDHIDHVLHKHLTGIPLSEFFTSLSMHLDQNCLTLDNQQTYCTDAEHSLKYFVNGEPHATLHDYEFQEADRILISYGPTNDPNVENQIRLVTDDACIFSKTCPDRGTPPTETCTGSIPCTIDEPTHQD